MDGGNITYKRKGGERREDGGHIHTYSSTYFQVVYFFCKATGCTKLLVLCNLYVAEISRHVDGDWGIDEVTCTTTNTITSKYIRI